VKLIAAQRASVAAARAAGELIRQNLFAAKKINLETSHDIKLELDVRCQRLIEKKLHAAFPQIAFLGEEGSSGPEHAPFRWVVDPIDGTVNFAHSIPHASVSIALQRPVTHHASRITTYETIVGVVFDPFTDELWTAVRGGLARLNGRVIRVTKRHNLADGIASIGFAKNRTSLERALPYFVWLSRRVRKIRIMGSAALALAYVATGRFDAYIERGISLWDVAAGGLIVECAGGKFWLERARGRHRYRMIASNGVLHDKLPIPK
jgi:myo-inositol-1(or 4)-monophosphatase